MPLTCNTMQINGQKDGFNGEKALFLVKNAIFLTKQSPVCTLFAYHFFLYCKFASAVLGAKIGKKSQRDAQLYPRCRNGINGANEVKQKRLFDSSTPPSTVQRKDKTRFTLQKGR